MKFTRIALVSSTQDTAGMTIKRAVVARQGVKELSEKWNGHSVYHIPVPSPLICKYYTTDKDSVHCENIDKELEVDLIIFLTKHASKHEIHSLTCHPIGNWGNADFGGKPRTLVPAPGTLIKECIKKIKEVNENICLGFESTTECTHHGPYLEVPTMFLEIGSTEEQYKRGDAGQAICEVLFYLLENVIPHYDQYSYKQAVGLGGTHYSANFQKIMQNTDIAISHVMPKHHLEQLDETMLSEICAKNGDGKLDMVLVDWKGVGPHKEKITELLNRLRDRAGIEWTQVQKLERKV